MARIIRNTNLKKENLNKEQSLWVYCGLDCEITTEVWNKLSPQLDNHTKNTYEFERSCLGPAISMVLRGLRVDERAVTIIRAPLKKKKLKLERMLNLFANAVWDKNLNHNSPYQLKEILYTYLNLPEEIKYGKGESKISTDRNALEHLSEEYPRARPFCKTIMALRDVDKMLTVLASKRDDDGRIRCTYQVAGTQTGRWSSKESPWGTGTNLQNITKDLRAIFIPDRGRIMFYADLQAAESRATAYLSGDEGYINAAESSDLHTEVAKMVWPNLGWSEDQEQNRELAEQPYFGNYTYRDVCKRAGHGTNYGASHTTVSRNIKIKGSQAKRFQLLYYGGVEPLNNLNRWHKQDKRGGFEELIEMGEVIGSGAQQLVKVKGAFPGIRSWHDEVVKELQTTGNLITPFGRRRQFWGRLDDEHYARKAIAYLPQSLVGDILNLGLYRIWKELFEDGVEILGQVHDAVLGQCPIDKVDILIPKVLDCLNNPIEVKGRKMMIPSDAEVGDSWKNLRKWNEKK